MTRARPYLVLAVLWGAYFHPLVARPTAVLYADYSDFLAEHLPVKLLLNREWRAHGELPLWNPYQFCGTPLVHDIQAGVFYPPYAVTYLVPEAAVGAALSWVVALHVLAAGGLAFAYARWRGLGEAGGLVAAAGFMLSAKWMTHLLLAGHTITVGLAWLPLVLLGLERAVRTGGAGGVVLAGCGFALVLLGTHPQWAFYAGVFAAAWTLGPALERAGYLGGDGGRSRGRTARAVGRWLACGLGAVAVAGLLAAVQLLPTWEAAGQSARSVGLAASVTLRTGLAAAVAVVGPSVGYDPPGSWETRALFGAGWLAAALAAPRLAGGRAGWEAGVFVGLVAFALGGAVLVEWLPGFRLFRLPVRMLLVAVFPLAYLAGVATDALVRRGWDPAARRLLGRLVLGVLAVTAPPVLAQAVAPRLKGDPVAWPPFVAYWATVAAAVPLVGWACRPSAGGGTRARTAAWGAVLLAELVSPTAGFVAVRGQADVYPPSRTTGYLTAHARPGHDRVLDRDLGGLPTEKVAALGIGAPAALVYGLETPRGYNPLDVRHYREFVGYVAGLDARVLALGDVGQPVLPNFEVVNRPLFDLLNVRFLVCPTDAPVDPAVWRLARIDPAPPLVPAIPPHHPPHLPPHAVYEAVNPAPRTFAVPEARGMPAGGELPALTATDLSRAVLLTTPGPLPPSPGPGGPAHVVEHRPNRVRVAVDGRGGWLVLGDVWFPGWVCRVDGASVPVYRANHAFRAVAVPAGAREAVFTFEPRSYRVGWWVSVWSAGLLAALTVGGLGTRVVRGRAYGTT